MDGIRRRLRLGAALWLLSQAASLSAFAPMECCDGHHGTAVEVGSSCHRTPVKNDCDCRLTSACPGPSAGLLAVLSNHGVLATPPAIPADFRIERTHAPGATRIARLQLPPDLPPPRV